MNIFHAFGAMLARARPLAGTAALGAALTLAASANAAYPEVTLTGNVSANGIFDPSVEYDPSGATGWLSYSAVYGNVTPWGPHVETRLARSNDHGATWTFEQVINPSTVGSLFPIGGGEIAGVWNTEVSTLVHDPGDPGREWKLFGHRIFRRSEDGFSGEQNEPAYSWIVMRSASDPGGLWSGETALMSSGPLPPAPYDGVQVALNALHPSLADLLVYSEPGAYAEAGVLYLSLTGLTASGPDRIALFASDDHGATWRYVATPLRNTDAPGLGYDFFDGSSIAAEAGRVFLLVTPGTPALVHDGTLVFEFADLSTGELVRSGGAPVVHKVIPLQPAFASERGAGQSSYHTHNTAGGVLMPQINLSDFPRFFQIFATGERLVDGAPVPALIGGVRWIVAASLLLWTGRLTKRRIGSR